MFTKPVNDTIHDNRDSRRHIRLNSRTENEQVKFGDSKIFKKSPLSNEGATVSIFDDGENSTSRSEFEKRENSRNLLKRELPK